MVNDRKRFLLTKRTTLIAVGPLYKDLGTLVDTSSANKVLLGEYYLPVDFGEHV